MLRSRLLMFVLASLVAVLLVPAAASAAFGPLAGINAVGGGPTDTMYQLDYPGSVVRVPDGPNYSFYVTDANNNRVVKLDSDGKFLFAFGGPTGGAASMSGPRSIAYGGGHLYVATNGYYNPQIHAQRSACHRVGRLQRHSGRWQVQQHRRNRI